MGHSTRTRWAGLWFFGVLGFGIVAQFADLRPNDLADESAITAPEFAPSRFLDDDYFAEVDDWLSRDFALRGAGLRARAAVDYDLFGDSTVPSHIIAGDGGWLFWAPYVDPDCSDLRALRPPVDMSSTADLHFVISAPKGAYHGDALPDPESPCVADARAELQSAFGTMTVDLDADLRALRASGDDVFLRDDTHWSMGARAVAARSIVESLAPGTWRDDLLAFAEVERLAGLARSIGIRRTEPLLGPMVTAEVTIGERSVAVLGDELLLVQASTTEDEWAIPGVTYLVGDSQLAHIVPLLAPYFEDLRYVNWLRLETFGFPADDWPDPDRVVVQSIEAGLAGHLVNDDLASYIERLDRDE